MLVLIDAPNFMEFCNLAASGDLMMRPGLFVDLGKRGPPESADLQVL